VWAWRANFALMTLMTFLTFSTGGFNLRVYAVEIFERSGAGTEAASQAVVALGAVKLAATVCGLWRVDVDGRKRLLLASTSGMAVSAAAVAMVLALAAPPSKFAFALIAAASLFYTAFFQIGFGTCNFVLTGEVFPPRLKGRLTSALKLPTACFQAASQFVWALALEPTRLLVVLFAVQCALGLVGFLVVRAVMVETKQSDADDVRRRLSETPAARWLASTWLCCCCAWCCCPAQQNSSTGLGVDSTKAAAIMTASPRRRDDACASSREASSSMDDVKDPEASDAAGAVRVVDATTAPMAAARWGRPSTKPRGPTLVELVRPRRLASDEAGLVRLQSTTSSPGPPKPDDVRGQAFV